MQRDDSTVNDDKQSGHDDANANPGSGASGPGELGYGQEPQVSGDGGEAVITIEERAAEMEADPNADPAVANADPSRVSADGEVLANPEVQEAG